MSIDAIAALPIPYDTLCAALRVESEEEGATLLRVVGRTLRATPLNDGCLLHLALQYDTAPETLGATLRKDLADVLGDLDRVYVYPSVAKPESTTYQGVLDELGEGGEWIPLPSTGTAIPADMGGLLQGLAGALPPDIMGQMGAMMQDPDAMAQFAKMAEGLMSDPSMRAMVEQTAAGLQGGDNEDMLAKATELAQKAASENPDLLAGLGIPTPDEPDQS